MPKMKTHRGAAKRIPRRRAPASFVRARSSNKQHILTKKSSKRKRKLRRWALIVARWTRSASSRCFPTSEGAVHRAGRETPCPESSAEVAANKRKKRILRQAKGYYGARGNLLKTAREAVEKGWKYAYRDRKQRKRQFRSSVDRAHQRRGARARPLLQPLMHGLSQAGVEVDRKILAQISPCQTIRQGLRGARRAREVEGRLAAARMSSSPRRLAEALAGGGAREPSRRPGEPRRR